MKNIILAFITLLFSQFVFAQQAEQSREEKAFDALKQSGLVRQEGNIVYFKVEKASDTVAIKKQYDQFFKSKEWKIAFDIKNHPNEKAISTDKPKKQGSAKKGMNDMFGNPK